VQQHSVQRLLARSLWQQENAHVSRIIYADSSTTLKHTKPTALSAFDLVIVHGLISSYPPARASYHLSPH
jgi:hypothetical protein